MNHGEIELRVGEVSNMEARVYARFVPGPGHHVDEQVALRGTLRGPYCERARTLPAEFAFRDLGPKQPGLAEAVVTDPCQWSEELPHLYHAEVEARRGDEVVATLQGKIGLRRTATKQD